MIEELNDPFQSCLIVVVLVDCEFMMDSHVLVDCNFMMDSLRLILTVYLVNSVEFKVKLFYVDNFGIPLVRYWCWSLNMHCAFILTNLVY